MRLPPSPRFQSTPPRGGRRVSTLYSYIDKHFNPRPPRGGRLPPPAPIIFFERFQSTPPARGGDRSSVSRRMRTMKFQSTPPARGATAPSPEAAAILRISIHAPREGGDFFSQFILIILMISIHAPREGGDSPKVNKASWTKYFNPRPPRGGRPGYVRRDVKRAIFQSTPPARGATIWIILGVRP